MPLSDQQLDKITAARATEVVLVIKDFVESIHQSKLALKELEQDIKEAEAEGIVLDPALIAEREQAASGIRWTNAEFKAALVAAAKI